MSIITTIKGWLSMLFDKKAREVFGVRPLPGGTTESIIEECANAYAGVPNWAGEDIKTINFAQTLCSEIARLTMLATGIVVDGSARAELIQQEIDDFYFDIRRWVEYGCASGIVILKPNGAGVDVVLPKDFVVTAVSGGKIRGAIFSDTQYDGERDRYYTRLEYHRFLPDGTYAISNRCFESKSEGNIGNPVDIDATPWVGLAEDVVSENIEEMLFGVFKMPGANNIDPSSPYSLPAFAGVLQELEDLDVAYSRNAREIWDSKRTILLDSDRLLTPGKKLTSSALDSYREAAGLPDMVKVISGTGAGDIYHEINPTLNTDVRLTGLNSLLSQIGFKCGFSQGYFVFNEKTGMITATQVESDDRRTIQLIKDVRDQLESCLNGLIYAIDKMLDNEGAPVGTYEVTYDFGDITYNREEDRARWYSYVTAGKVPFWMYLVKFEGYSEEDAKEIEEAAKPRETLYGDEE